VPRAQERRWRAAADGEQADCLLLAWHCSRLTELLSPPLSPKTTWQLDQLQKTKVVHLDEVLNFALRLIS